MEVTITEFRRSLFDYVSRAMAGETLRVTHRGERFRIVPERAPADRLSRITPLAVINPEAVSFDSEDWKREMVESWERDWATL